jgi:hypothetical protein
MRTSAIVAVFACLCLTTFVKAESRVVIAGHGSGTCGEFRHDYDRWGQGVEVTYFAWAQGYMSAVQIPRPESDQINLLPLTFHIEEQMRFLRDFCADNSFRTYEEAVAALYNRLGALEGQKPYFPYLAK